MDTKNLDGAKPKSIEERWQEDAEEDTPIFTPVPTK